MESIYSMVKAATQRSLVDDMDVIPYPTKAFSVRVSEPHIALLDQIAEDINVSRNSLLADIIVAGVEEALSAYTSVFQNPKELANEMRAKAGLGVWHSPSDDNVEHNEL